MCGTREGEAGLSGEERGKGVWHEGDLPGGSSMKIWPLGGQIGEEWERVGGIKGWEG